jgi:hypothetical protein
MILSTPTFKKKKQKQAQKTLNPKRKPGALTKETFSVFSQITSPAIFPGCRWAATEKILFAKVEQGLGLSNFDLHLLYQCLLYALSAPKAGRSFKFWSAPLICPICRVYHPPPFDVPW